MTAFVYPSGNSSLIKQNAFPSEYYKEFARSPKILNEVLQKLPEEVKFYTNISPLDQLSSMLRVKTKITQAAKDLTTSALMLTFYVRQTDPSALLEIAKAWKAVLIEKSLQAKEDEISGKFHQIEEQFKLSKADWDTAKNKLADYQANHSIENKTLELNSIQRLISKTYQDYEVLLSIMNSNKNPIGQILKYQAEIQKLEEGYVEVKGALDELKRRADLQLQSKKALNPIDRRLDHSIIADEVLLASISSKKVHLEKLVRELESDTGKSKPEAQVLEFPANGYQANILKQMKNLKKQIKQYEDQSRKLNSQISQQKQAYKTLAGDEAILANLYKVISKRFEEMKVLKSEKTRGINFASSALEPVVFVGSPMRVNISVAAMVGLTLSIFFTLLQVRFGGKNTEKIEKKPADSQYPEENYAEPASTKSNFIENEVIISPSYSPVIAQDPEPQNALTRC